MVKKSNHYVPQFYLRNFSDNKKTVGVYLLKKQMYVRTASIRTQACRDFMYGDDGVIEDMLMELETVSSRIIHEIIRSRRVPDKSTDDYRIDTRLLDIAPAF